MLPPDVTLPGCLACGACCRDIDIPLTRDELHQLDADGTVFTLHRGPNAQPVELADGRRLYSMVGWCGNLVCDEETGETRCKRYDERPLACREYVASGPNCRYTQVLRRVITEAHLEQPGAEAYLEAMLDAATSQP